MGIDLTLIEACYLRIALNDRIDYLNRRIRRLERFINTEEDPVVFQKRCACVTNELEELKHVHSELNRFIAHSVVHGLLMDEYIVLPKKIE